MVRNKLRNTLENTTANKGLDALKALRLAGYDRDYITETGPYLAKVLRVEPLLQNNTWVENAVANADNEAEDGQNAIPNPMEPFRQSFAVTARISSMEGRQIGIHDFIPEPEQLGTKEEIKGDFLSEAAIFNHDVFVPQTLDLPPPELGSYIWVDYLDKQNLQDGIYIRQMIPSDSIAFPTLTSDCNKPNLNKNTPGAATGKKPDNPGLGKSKTPAPTPEVISSLTGYQIQDFTKTESFKTGATKKNLLKIVGVAEVITMFFKTLYPKASIKVIDPTAGRPAGQPEAPELIVKEAAAFHHSGRALKVEVHKDGNPLPKEEIYAALCLLILKGKLPPGGLGFFQTNKGNGTNKGISTTLRTNKKASDFPHYDMRETESYWIVSTEKDKQVVSGMKININNWINLSKPGRNKTNLPPHVYQAYLQIAKKMPKKFPNLDTTLAAIEQKKTTPSTGSSTPAEENKEENTDAAQPNSPPETDADKDKKKEDEKKKAKKDETPDKMPTAPVIPCPPPGAPAGGAANTPDGGAANTPDGGAGAGALATGKIGMTAGKKPRGEVIDPDIVVQHFGELENLNNYFKRKNRKLTMFVLHYTDSEWATLNICRERKKKIVSTINKHGGRNSFKNSGARPHTAATVHLWAGRAGDWVQQLDLMSWAAHAGSFNRVSVGIENCLVGVLLGNADAQKRGANQMIRGQKFIGKYGTIGGKLYTNKRKGSTAIKMWGNGYGYGIPSNAQLEVNYQLCKWLTGFTGKGKPRNQPPHDAKHMNIPMVFNANSSPDKSLCVYNKEIFKGDSAFIWQYTSGQLPRLTNGFGKKVTGHLAKAYWEPLKKGNDLKGCNQGIIGHVRNGGHIDGDFFEYYVLGRVLGLNPRNAFFACIGAIAHAGVYTHGPSAHATDRQKSNLLTFFPTYVGKTNVGVNGYVAAGKKLWDASGFDESDINSHVGGSSLFDPNQYSNWLSSQKGQNMAKHVKGFASAGNGKPPSDKTIKEWSRQEDGVFIAPFYK